MYVCTVCMYNSRGKVTIQERLRFCQVFLGVCFLSSDSLGVSHAHLLDLRHGVGYNYNGKSSQRY